MAWIEGLVVVVALAAPLVALVWGVHRRGYQKGVDAEHLRVNEVFHATTQVIYGGSVKAVWLCVNGDYTVEQMNTRLREAQERKEEMKERLKKYEGTSYGNALANAGNITP